MIKDSEKFDIENLVARLSYQADKIVPEDINLLDKKYIVSTLYNFMKVAYEGLEKEEELFDIEKVTFIVQIIGEWIFHKGVDLIRTKIKKEYCNIILQKIAFVVYEIAKKAVMENFTEEKTIQAIEHHVKKTYDEELKILYEKGCLNNEKYQYALSQSNIDIMAEEEYKNQNNTINSELINYIKYKILNILNCIVIGIFILLFVGIIISILIKNMNVICIFSVLTFIFSMVTLVSTLIISAYVKAKQLLESISFGA